MENVLQALLDAGYEVEFAKVETGYLATVETRATDVLGYDTTSIALTPEVALLAAAPDCECGHEGAEHGEASPDVDGLRGGRMCGRDDCMCLAYRPAA